MYGYEISQLYSFCAGDEYPKTPEQDWKTPRPVS